MLSPLPLSLHNGVIRRYCYKYDFSSLVFMITLRCYNYGVLQNVHQRTRLLFPTFRHLGFTVVQIIHVADPYIELGGDTSVSSIVETFNVAHCFRIIYSPHTYEQSRVSALTTMRSILLDLQTNK
jgi:hypothetical protein